MRDASLAFIEHLGRNDVLEGLVGEFEIFLDVDVVLDLHEDDWRGDEEGAAQEGPVGREEGHVLDLVEVEAAKKVSMMCKCWLFFWGREVAYAQVTAAPADWMPL